MSHAAPLLMVLPDGLSVSGVTVWAVRLANVLAKLGRPCGLIVHAEPAGSERIDVALEAGVDVYDASALACGGDADVARLARFYKGAVDDLADRHGGPVVLSPNLRAACYGAGAMLVRDGVEVRLVGWQHSDIEYDRRVLGHYAPAIERFVGVSDRIVDGLREGLGARGDDVEFVAYGVPVARRAAREAREGRPLRLIYTGRMEHRQKRILSLVHLSDALGDVAHELVLVGDGPAASEVDELVRGRANMRWVGAVGTKGVGALLEWADAFVLGSRYEGLSVSMLEAMGRGCVPIVTRVASGAAQAIEDGVNGILVDAGAEADERAVGAALAEGVRRFARMEGRGISERARRTVRERFSIGLHAQRVIELIDEVGASPARVWARDRSIDVQAVSVGEDGAALLEALLSSLAGRRIVVHGAGAHTRALWDVFERAPVEIAAIADDDRGVHGTSVHGVPVMAPEDVGATGATDVVISSWMHEGAIWERRGVYGGLGVHRVYGGARVGASVGQC